MNALAVLAILSIIQLGCCNFTNAKAGMKPSQNKTSREVEPFTTILLDDEPFSIVSIVKHPIYNSESSPDKRKENFNRIMHINPPMMAENERRHIVGNHKSKPYNAIPKKSHYVKEPTVRKEIAYNPNILPNKSHIRGSSFRNDTDDSAKILQNKTHYERGPSVRKPIPPHSANILPANHRSKVIKHAKEARLPNKKIHRRNFEKSFSYRKDKIRDLDKRKVGHDFGPTISVVFTAATEIPKNNLSNDQPKIFDSNALNLDNKNESYKTVNATLWENAERLTSTDGWMNVKRSVTLASSLSPIWLSSGSTPSSSTEEPFQDATQSSGDYKGLRIYKDIPTTTEDDSESDETVITFDGVCDRIENQTTCYVQREVGDVITLALKISSSKKISSFQIRWMKMYHKFDSNKDKPLELDTGKLPWNMVSGSEGRQLRLNPVANSDIDPNCFVAQVFLIKRHQGKVYFTKLKKLIFRIEIPVIDMGKLYAGQEVGINIENFVSLPERGNLLFQWNLETKPREYESLPSNIKVSPSGRSVLLKELKTGRFGILNCVIYSSNRYAVAKRRFNLFNIGHAVKRRSTMSGDDHEELLRIRQCRHLIRKREEEAKQKLEEFQKPKSRKKRFRRMQSDNQLSELDCKRLRKRAYPRVDRSLYADFITEDPRLMPLEKLFELSEQGDGTLDNVIPREIHYVKPEVRLIAGTAMERSADHPVWSNCTKHSDCTENADCIVSEDVTNFSEQKGNCYCRPEFYRDGTMCRKIPLSTHREKRLEKRDLKRNARNRFAARKHLFHQNSREIVKSTPETFEEDENAGTEVPKILAFEEMESFLLTDCIDDRDCSIHANCIQPTNGHPYCKCRPGFRGNGIFCWEMMDYVPAEEQFLPDEENSSSDESLELGRDAFKTVEPPEVEEE